MAWLADLFNKYGVYFFLGLLVLNLAILAWVFILRKNFKAIFKSNSPDGGLDLECVLLELRENQSLSAKTTEELKERIVALETAIPKNIRKVGLVRYNPFSDAGGDQSFALALLNDQNDGIIISSLYGREVNRVYAKPIQNGASQYQLTEEEKNAIQNAK
ncbi:MAG: hypothetical protein UW81_C0038G0002 [Candidatus Giovannonibacteria bacterium GW2011_GWC2_44_9]|uniref:DUF4446 domain-containing protein n=3 Tax=Candidatus Giovannoniibacteriota TaxID=1752738 RepID=A0A1F5WB04_9BACT|nr:MAG: hypothetical protein UW15_C0020G0003 [Parcubacteria group bacterium GW2011_GWC1_44_10]KKT59411.1 MAG: hypothetical protein UW53_C0013G0012 [Candidatus Giovannonibacteria bacterium GW2011_GWA1_44_25]KKT82610.1 MAG: hypothetical protein UW81_C0038G0002 [Candidatus Giovannonibacteria bacterium GW2011_GWC2_44_9]KKU29528.1 MAG: hypothetical protein UX43_C0010G0012 [Candidatus Giovannonibacteria bacterium GW2011_GWB1_46_20]OGF49107.1 MAG: hypothetical protein A2120_04800 [Candidatus Giovannon